MRLYMFRSVWDQIHYDIDIICLYRTGSNLNSMVPYGITFISGPIWYQRADLIHTGSTKSHVFEHKAYPYQFHTGSKRI